VAAKCFLSWPITGDLSHYERLFKNSSNTRFIIKLTKRVGFTLSHRKRHFDMKWHDGDASPQIQTDVFSLISIPSLNETNCDDACKRQELKGDGRRLRTELFPV
jgi:hypothetical protein